MCACDEGLRPAYTCPRCVGTWLDPRCPELPDPRAADETARYAAGGETRTADDE